MASLQHFLKVELARRAWSIPDFAERAGISQSNAYFIVQDGHDNVRQDTLEAIASALGMSLVELNTATGKGRPQDALRAPLIAAVHDVADEQVPLALSILQSLRRQGSSKRRSDVRSKRLKARAAEIQQAPEPGAAPAAHRSLSDPYSQLPRIPASAIGRLVATQ